MLQRRIVGMKRQRNKRDEALRLVLQRAQLQQMVDTVLVGFNVAI